MQAANVQAILESDPNVASVRHSLNDALALLDDVNENLATFDTKLLVMREDIAAIEVRPLAAFNDAAGIKMDSHAYMILHS